MMRLVVALLCLALLAVPADQLARAAAALVQQKVDIVVAAGTSAAVMGCDSGGMYPTLETRRLQLRAWREHDVTAFAALNADARVMEFLPKPIDRAESDALAWCIRDHFAHHGFGLWAVEAPGVADFIGFVGLSVPSFQAPFMPCVEIGWRLAYEYWGHGYATEAARVALAFGFREDTVEHRRP